MRGTIKRKSGYVAAVVALLVFGFSLFSTLARRVRGVEPHVKIERRKSASEIHNAEINARYMPVLRTINGEVSITAERRREAAMLAAGATMIALLNNKDMTKEGMLKRIAELQQLPPRSAFLSLVQNGSKATAAGMIKQLVDMKEQPSGAVIGEKENTLTTPYGTLVLYHRPRPLGIEVLSLAKNKKAGPALIVRIDDMPGSDGFRIWEAQKLENIQIPQPFCPEALVIAAGWMPEDTPEMRKK